MKGAAGKIFNFIIVLALLNGVFLVQLSYDSWRLAFQRKPDLPANVVIEPHPLSSKAYQKSDLGLDNFMADIIWLQTIQYYGGGMPNEMYRKLPDLLNLTTDLDQRFSYPYTLGLLILPGNGPLKEAIKFGEKGMKDKYLKDDWEIPYYLGMIYHINLKNYLQAAKLFTEAANRRGAPAITKLMAATYYAKADQRETAYNLYRVVYATNTNKYVKERAKLYIDHWDLIFGLEAAANIFDKQYGRLPNNLQEMVDKKIIQAIPADPLGRQLQINPTTGVVSEVD